MNSSEQNSLLDRYRQLAEMSRDLASTLDLNDLLNRIVHLACALSQSEAASILLFDEPKNQLYFQAATNLDEPLMRGLIVPVENSIAGWIVRHRKPLIIQDAQRDERHFNEIQKITKYKTESLLGVPLITKGKVIGVLEALNKHTGHFTLLDQELLIALGAQAAVAIENTRLFQQSDLIAELVHELRTPLTSLNNAARLILIDDLPAEKRKEMTELITIESSRLDELASTYLDFARLESGRVQFISEKFDLAELIYECTEILSSKVTDKNLKLTIQLSGELPPITADRDKVKQVILNLLDNAVKYNHPGGQIIISAKIRAKSLILRVFDSGYGIPSGDMNWLFKKFFRSKSSQHLIPGTGLGLAICKSIVESHRGHIRVRSRLGKGSIFTVSLPLKPGENL
ncbi:MAG: GAF domain-containing protein [Anaerolineales bacterium]|nr:GAF domain-containing protein [Anaerolineales bacterium]